MSNPELDPATPLRLSAKEARERVANSPKVLGKDVLSEYERQISAQAQGGHRCVVRNVPDILDEAAALLVLRERGFGVHVYAEESGHLIAVAVVNW